MVDQIDEIQVRKVVIPSAAYADNQTVPYTDQDQRVNEVFKIPRERIEEQLATLTASIQREIEKGENANTNRLQNLLHNYMFFLIRESARLAKEEEIDLTTLVKKKAVEKHHTYDAGWTVSWAVAGGLSAIAGGLLGFSSEKELHAIGKTLSEGCQMFVKVSENYDQQGRVLIDADLELLKGNRTDRNENVRQQRDSMQQNKQAAQRLREQAYNTALAILR